MMQFGEQGQTSIYPFVLQPLFCDSKNCIWQRNTHNENKTTARAHTMMFFISGYLVSKTLIFSNKNGTHVTHPSTRLFNKEISYLVVNAHPFVWSTAAHVDTGNVNMLAALPDY